MQSYFSQLHELVHNNSISLMSIIPNYIFVDICSYKVSCNSDGTGDITYCSDINCGSCSITAPFQGEVCLPNDAQRFGTTSSTQ